MQNDHASTMEKFGFGVLINCAAMLVAEGIYEFYLRLIVVQDRSFEFLADFWFYTYIVVAACFLLMREWKMATGALLGYFVVIYFLIPLGWVFHPLFVFVIVVACFLLIKRWKVATVFLSISVVLFYIIPFLFDLE